VPPASPPFPPPGICPSGTVDLPSFSKSILTSMTDTAPTTCRPRMRVIPAGLK